ncbi:hypothetical protein [Polyangium aurulentum]|uniref:hypothetical protein n=1 Tax=Polyangium aurulentum TaxID=2567896 RepID=UPI00146AC4F2|nr:hypothetical protein [Polyangium aurulentum]UQA58643.1 hypothetical protein E8A73_046650 [Polyangium aurulentum]
MRPPLPRLASTMGLVVCLGLAFTPVGCGGSEEGSYEPRHAGGSDGPTAPASTVAQLEACAHGGVGSMKEGTYYAILVDADVGESGYVERVKVRDSDVAGQGIEACMVNALGAMQVPRYIVQRMIASGPVSPGSRGAMGNVMAAAGAAVTLVPIVIVAAGVTFIVAVTLHAAEEAVEASKRRRKVERLCYPPLYECLENNQQPDWNRENFGTKKDCRVCFDECMKDGAWPNYKCPRPGYRPN